MTDVSARIHTVVRSQKMRARAVDLDVNTSLRGDLRANDLDVMCLMIGIEEEFDVLISDDEIAAVETLGDIEQLLAGKMGVRA